MRRKRFSSRDTVKEIETHDVAIEEKEFRHGPDSNENFGASIFVIDIDRVTRLNRDRKRTLWTGDNLQLALMNIDRETGVERNSGQDQFIKVESGRGVVQFGNNKDRLNRSINLERGIAVVIPAGVWHNVINKSKNPLKVYTLYAPPHNRRVELYDEKINL